MSRHVRRILPLLLVAAAVQCSLLAWGDGDPGRNLLAAGVCLGLLAVPLAGNRHLSERIVTMLLVTGCLGGLGMLVGTRIDAALGVPPPACHAVAVVSSPAAGSVVNWMNGLMLAACIPGCWFLCPRCEDHRREFLCHFGCAVGMCIGMIAGGRLLGDMWTARLGAFGGMHLAMLAGMLVGVAATEATRLPFARQRTCP